MKRTIINMNEGWLFTKQSINIQNPDLEIMELVDLPHTWNATDGADGGDDYYRGVCWYGKKFQKPKGDRIFLEFLAASQVAKVYINGELVGTHTGGFSTFRIDVTDKLGDDENLLLVSVDNSESSSTYPQYADFTFFGGLYRGVNLIVLPETHFELIDNGGPGIYVTSNLKSEGSATVEIKGCISKNVEEVYKFTIYDSKGSVVDTVKTHESTYTFSIEEPHLWNGIEDPYLYTATIEMIGSGDEVSTRFGIRSYYVDNEKGFFLNGKSYPLRGVSRHQDRFGKGWAISSEDHKEDAELIREIGANTVRLAHYQHAQEFYDLCDEMGFVVWAEIPFISRFMDTKEAHDDTISQMTELVLQNYNHPSICFWGISNEITMNGECDALVKNQKELNDLCHKLDPTRLTTMAQLGTVEGSSEQNHITDLVAYNIYIGWYTGKTEKCGEWMDDLHGKNSDFSVGISEYGADANIKIHSSTPKRQDYSEEYQCLYHEEMLRTINARPYLWSTYVWNMFEFAADRRKEGGTVGMNSKGLITYDRRIKKDSFYLYKAYWTKEPFVHICSRRFKERPGDTTSIKVYGTGIDAVRLLVDGVQVAEVVDEHIFMFESVTLTSTHKVLVQGLHENHIICSDEIELSRTDEINPEYVLVGSENEGVNWFLDEYGKRQEIKAIDGFFSIYDDIGDIIKTPQGEEIIKQMFSLFNKAEAAVNLTNSMMEAIKTLSLEELVKLSGAAISREKLNQINEILVRIPKI